MHVRIMTWKGNEKYLCYSSFIIHVILFCIFVVDCPKARNMHGMQYVA